jgi:hypothetical protein
LFFLCQVVAQLTLFFIALSVSPPSAEWWIIQQRMQSEVFSDLPQEKGEKTFDWQKGFVSDRVAPAP